LENQGRAEQSLAGNIELDLMETVRMWTQDRVLANIGLNLEVS
jgi:hypothetical protein